MGCLDSWHCGFYQIPTNKTNLNLTASAGNLMCSSWIFHQDNDPKQKAYKSAQKWVTEHKLKALPWPSQSPDLNPIDNLWCELKRWVYQHEPGNLKDLERLCMEELDLCVLLWMKVFISQTSLLIFTKGVIILTSTVCCQSASIVYGYYSKSH